MKDPAIENLLPGLMNDLSEILGDDMAESLVRAAQSSVEGNLDLHLAISDGLESVGEEDRTRVLEVLAACSEQVEAARQTEDEDA